MQRGYPNVWITFFSMTLTIKTLLHVAWGGLKGAELMNALFDQLKNCIDVNDLRAALSSFCSRFGSIARLDILAATQGTIRQALCFLRMDSPEQEEALVSEFGVGRFGGDLVVVVDLPPIAPPQPHGGAPPLHQQREKDSP